MRRTGSSAASAGHTAAKAELNVAVPMQEQTNWCWAAAALGITSHYTGATGAQCTFVSRLLRIPGCCGTARGGPCDQPYFLDVALRATGCLRKRRHARLGFAAIQNEISLKRPLGVRIGWSGPDGHFIVVSGWETTSAGEEFVIVNDPADGSVARTPYTSLATAYGTDRGRWTHSFQTAANMPTSGTRPLLHSRESLGG